MQTAPEASFGGGFILVNAFELGSVFVVHNDVFKSASIVLCKPLGRAFFHPHGLPSADVAIAPSDQNGKQDRR